MKTSPIFVLMMLLASSTLAVMPANAADCTLGIFGNANMDDTIDEDDIAYVEGIIEGTNEETELADANYLDIVTLNTYPYPFSLLLIHAPDLNEYYSKQPTIHVYDEIFSMNILLYAFS